ncbi:MAG: hypothetical protein KDC85_04505 [Saprospiraceae bacterium]|nr:hypothetical protein [Saprospiraceae bacterium]MCB9322801.1 hypothetical protein [Lewinellaceae bacterium]
MKKLISAILAVAFIFGTAQAQDGKKALKNASKAISTYYLDQSKKEKLQEAVDEIEIATTGTETAGDYKTWETRGKIYNEIATQIAVSRQLGMGGEAALPQVEDPGYLAFESYAKALELAEKKFQIKEACEGIQAAQQNLYNLGIYSYEDKNFESAVKDFKTVITAHDLLKKQDAPSNLDDATAYSDQVYVTALAAINAGMDDLALEYFMRMYNEGTDKPAVYESIYKLKMEEDLAGAYKYLEEGRQKFPEDVSLLFTEINHFLKENRLNELIAKLEMAIEKEPENLSLYSTMGNVYDNLYQKANEAGDKEKAEEYFAQALKYYTVDLEKDPTYFDAIYSVGALYFNKGAFYTVEENKILADCTKPACMKDADALRAKANENFNLAFPYFQSAEKINPNDINTLIALKEILVRQDRFDDSNEIKARLENVQNGGTNETSFFKD